MKAIDKQITTHVLVSGAVVNVGFRAFVVRNAIKLGLSGWVKNNQDDNVEALFSGSEEKVKEMLSLCKQGPPGSFVQEIKTLDIKKSEIPLSGFRIVY